MKVYSFVFDYNKFDISIFDPTSVLRKSKTGSVIAEIDGKNKYLGSVCNSYKPVTLDGQSVLIFDDHYDLDKNKGINAFIRQIISAKERTVKIELGKIDYFKSQFKKEIADKKVITE
jgi:hypothetical protein